jgi:thiol-disulfide isomerase/thioredoxin
MRRAHALFRSALATAAFCALPACDDIMGASATPPAPTSRTESVAAKAVEDPLKDFCDVRAEPGKGKDLRVPALESGTALDAQKSFVWLNLWATWCKPCVDELPRIAAWQKKLAAEGKPIDVRFLSVDESPEAVTAFRAEHPGMPESLRLADQATLSPFVHDVGLDSGAGLPVHIFVEKGGHIRCVRSGAVLDSNYATITSMLQ